jgi:hypothetical protein
MAFFKTPNSKDLSNPETNIVRLCPSGMLIVDVNEDCSRLPHLSCGQETLGYSSEEMCLVVMIFLKEHAAFGQPIVWMCGPD